MSNEEKKYCYAKAASPKSATYYSLRNLTVKQRDLVVAVHAFYREIEDILFECPDHELAATKFNWWRLEVTKISHGNPEHPVTLLLKTLNKSENLQSRLLAIIDGIEQISISSSFPTFEDTVIHFMRTAGERELLINEVLQTQPIPSEIIYQLMLVVELVNYLQHLRHYVRRDLIYFPTDELTQFQVSKSILHEFKTTPEIKNLLQHQAEKVERAYLEAVKALTPTMRDELSHLLLRCEMARATLKEIQATDFCVLENLITLTPLRYWWIAYRASKC